MHLKQKNEVHFIWVIIDYLNFYEIQIICPSTAFNVIKFLLLQFVEIWPAYGGSMM